MIDDDDSMAANPEPIDIGQRRRKATGVDGHFKVIWVDGKNPNQPAAPAKVCRECHQPASVLHQDPRANRVDREVCGACQGRINRDRMGGRQ